jgi:hypothetical protein
MVLTIESRDMTDARSGLRTTPLIIAPALRHVYDTFAVVLEVEHISMLLTCSFDVLT